MRKRALKKRREELRELLADRREALGELVLGMHVQGVWDDGLLARGAAEVAPAGGLRSYRRECRAKQRSSTPRAGRAGRDHRAGSMNSITGSPSRQAHPACDMAT